MASNYSEYLEKEINAAEAAFNQAKADVIRDIDNMTAHAAEYYGAAYYSKIDKITKAASKWKSLAEAKRVYDFSLKRRRRHEQKSGCSNCGT